MKKFLLASAAAIAIAIAAPIAMAQYTTPPPAEAPYSTPLPDDTLTPPDETVADQPDAMTTPPMPEASDPPAPQDPAVADAGQPYEQQGQAGVGSAQAQAGEAQTAPTPQQAETMQTQQQAETYGVQTAALAESFKQHARDAGMDRLPMTAAEVCAPREVELTTNGSRLGHDKRRQLIEAADRASVCEIQRVVISSPDGRGEAVRQTLVDHGVDSSLIEVAQGDGGLDVEMNFAGVATSSEQYAAIFNPQTLAMAEPGVAPAPGAPMDDSSALDQAPSDDPLAPDGQDDQVVEPTSAEAEPAQQMNDI